MECPRSALLVWHWYNKQRLTKIPTGTTSLLTVWVVGRKNSVQCTLDISRGLLRVVLSWHHCTHYRAVKWVAWRLKSPADQVFLSLFNKMCSTKNSKGNIPLMALCAGNPLVTGGFPSQRASNYHASSWILSHYIKSEYWENSDMMEG